MDGGEVGGAVVGGSSWTVTGGVGDAAGVVVAAASDALAGAANDPAELLDIDTRISSPGLARS